MTPLSAAYRLPGGKNEEKSILDLLFLYVTECGKIIPYGFIKDPDPKPRFSEN